MEERDRLAVGIAGTAVLLGALADALLRVTPWGHNAALWTAALLVATSILASRRVSPLMGEGRLMAIPAIAFGLSFAWRDSPVLKTLDGCAVVICMGLLAFRGQHGHIRFGGACEYAVGVVRVLGDSVTAASHLVIEDIGWSHMPRGRWTGPLGAALRGLLLAAPLLLLFGWLLASADAVFERYLLDLTRFDVESVATHLLVTVACAWAVAGYLRSALLRADPPEPDLAEPAAPKRLLPVGAVEIGTAMALVNLLFLLFVLVQVRYLFGGGELVQARAWLTYAQYARRGFFELVWAAALALPLLLGAHAALTSTSRAARRLYRLQAGILVALLMVVLASAAQRMRLYQAEYGLTELRFYTSAFMVWLGAVLVWFCATVLAGRQEGFAFGAFAGALMAILVLHTVNPDAVIARTNMGRASHGKPVDTASVLALSADAIPEITKGLRGLPSHERSVLQLGLAKRWEEMSRPLDWREWSLSRYQGFRQLGLYASLGAEIGG